MHWGRRALMHAAGHWGRTGSLTSLPVLPLSLVDEEHWRRGWSTGHHRSLMDLGGTVDCRRVVDEFCSLIPFPFACTTDYHILRHPRCLRRLLGFRFRYRHHRSLVHLSGHPRGIALGRHSILPQPISLFLFITFLPRIPFSSRFFWASLFLFPESSQPVPRQFAYFSFEVSLPASHSYSHISSGFSLYTLSLRSVQSSLSLFPQTCHSLYLANLHISSSRSAYHHPFLFPYFFRVFGFSFGLYF
ncbi:hypothetical protein EV421DRAFT_368750 [Armillaria borealis]|uniref:Uncharacterized protein n=1 Tax=Armillaria borealis TaxID=47425 RepID=A0AA39JLM4_9AGAR|nr:hypothetical protein EV421DRAFT_368750 [Armillaria borealis]